MQQRQNSKKGEFYDNKRDEETGYNNELWQCRWGKEAAESYLTDFFEHKKFVGYVAEEGNIIVGGLFAHEKIWWNNSEIFIEEMFVVPEKQGKGIGTALLLETEKYIKVTSKNLCHFSALCL